MKMSVFWAKVSMSSASSCFDRLSLIVTFLSRTASSNGADFLFAWSLRSVLPFGMSGGSGKLLLAVSTELILR